MTITKHAPSQKPSSPPPWYCTQGDTMGVGAPNTALTPQADVYLHDGVVAQIAIAQVGTRDKYTLDWNVVHAGGLDNAHTSGRLELNSAELCAMFCHDDTMRDESSIWLIERYGGTVAAQGKFIRWGHYLNIPGPGTGHEATRISRSSSQTKYATPLRTWCAIGERMRPKPLRGLFI